MSSAPPPPHAAVPVTIDDPVNAAILAVSEDRVAGFHRDPLGFIARESGQSVDTVVARLRAMLEAGTIRRIRQTLLATNLAPGALIAWQLPAERLNDAFDFMTGRDPFTGHVVIRSTDAQTPGSAYRLWTTLKVPVGFSMTRHCDWLSEQTGAERYVLLPARKIFTLGVGHVRRKALQPGDRAQTPGKAGDVAVVSLDEEQWRVLVALKREFTAQELELGPDLWRPRAEEAGVSMDRFHQVADRLAQMNVIGRFSTFLEHVKRLKDGTQVTRYNALFHWAVAPGQEVAGGVEIGRHYCMTHAYWRDAGPEFNHVNLMGVAHGTDRDTVLAHKAAIDDHLREAGIDLRYTNVFWGGRSEIKPSEISPLAYRDWAAAVGLDATTATP